jgi:hypothetical protein
MRTLRSALAPFGVAVTCTIAACSTPTVTSSGPPGLTCSSPGEATPGPADMHCVGQPVQDVNPASCMNYDASSACGDDGGAPGDDGDGAGDDGGATGDDGGGAGDDGGAAVAANACDYGATMFGPGSDGGGPVVVEGDDDDCKYHVSWTSNPICQSLALGVTFTVTVTYLGTNPPLPVTNIPADEGILVEAFIPKTLNAACDDMGVHYSPTPFAPGHGLLQTSPGVYFGSVIFDQAGEWTLRFHIHEECSDLCANSPHGHAAFHINVP